MGGDGELEEEGGVGAEPVVLEADPHVPPPVAAEDQSPGGARWR